MAIHLPIKEWRMFSSSYGIGHPFTGTGYFVAFVISLLKFSTALATIFNNSLSSAFGQEGEN
jgi:hypothetical protein